MTKAKICGFWTRSGVDGRLYFYETAIDTWWYVVGGQMVRIKASRLPLDLVGLESGRRRCGGNCGQGGKG